MKHTFSLFLLLTSVSIMAQPTLTWQKTFGGSGHEYTVNTIPVSGGGFVFIGHTESSNGDVPDNSGETDLWVAKANAAGTLEWSFTYGGTYDDEGADIVQAADGTFFVAGWTDSNDGDVSGNHDTYSSDYWILHLSASGTVIKKKCFGGTSDDDAAAIDMTPDGAILVSGTTYSYDGDVSGNHGTYETDVWVIKLDTALNLIAQRCIGGTDYEEGINLVATSDNGCAITGRSYSSDGDVTDYHNGSDMLVAKLTSSLAIDWAKCFGGSETEEGNAIVQLSDGSFTVLGYTSTHNNGDVTGHHGASGYDDFWLVKLSTSGVIEWAKCYGGSGDDQADGLTVTVDGGYTMCGLTNSSDGDVTGYHSAMFAPDFWVAKTFSDGTLMWQRCCGGSDQDESFNVYEESANVYVVTGFTYSTDYDVTSNHGSADGWIIKITGVLGLNDEKVAITLVWPNPVNDKLFYENHIFDKFYVIDLQGNIVAEGCPSFENHIDVSNLDQGSYSVCFLSGQTISMARMLIVR